MENNGDQKTYTKFETEMLVSQAQTSQILGQVQKSIETLATTFTERLNHVNGSAESANSKVEILFDKVKTMEDLLKGSGTGDGYTEVRSSVLTWRTVLKLLMGIVGVLGVTNIILILKFIFNVL